MRLHPVLGEHAPHHVLTFQQSSWCTVDDGMEVSGGDDAIDPDASVEAEPPPEDEVIDPSAPAPVEAAPEEPVVEEEPGVDPLDALQLEGFDPDEEPAQVPQAQQVPPVLMPLMERFDKVASALDAQTRFQAEQIQRQQQQVLAQQQRSQAPAPPPPDAPVEDHLRHEIHLARWEHKQQQASVAEAVQRLVKATEADYQARNQAAQQAQMQAREQRAEYAFRSAVEQAKAVPGMEFLQSPRAATLAGVLWNTLRQESGGRAVDPRGVFRLMQEVIAEGRTGQAKVQQRTAAKTVLQARREAAKPPAVKPLGKPAAKAAQPLPRGVRFPEWATTDAMKRQYLLQTGQG